MGIKNVMMHERSVLDCINDGCMYYCSAIKGTMYGQEYLFMLLHICLV